MRNKILVVDDNADLLKVTALILRSQGYDVLTADNVQDAAFLIEQEKPSLLLLDVCICQDDGLAFCNQIKHSAATMDIKVIMMSGHEYGKEEWNGAEDFLFKPFDFNQLIEKVAYQLAAAGQEPAGVI